MDGTTFTFFSGFAVGFAFMALVAFIRRKEDEREYKEYVDLLNRRVVYLDEYARYLFRKLCRRQRRRLEGDEWKDGKPEEN